MNPNQILNKNAPGSRSRGEIRAFSRESDFRLTAEKIMQKDVKEYLPIMEKNPSRDKIFNSGPSGLPPRGRDMGARQSSGLPSGLGAYNNTTS
jgi:hypothetical protein